ncbi:hypothetical protein C8Q76DRAFT_135098 [Earliella scabrosa]|nr:hypothetical protein C8Q76DRAFT_135098 [Earliella scabrosa]
MSTICPVCEVRFTSTDVLATHHQLAHGPDKGSASSLTSPTCPVCRLQFASRAEFAAHINSTSSCSECRICLPQSQNLEDHYWDSPIHPKCRPCALAFQNHDGYATHKATCPIAPKKIPPKHEARAPSGSKSSAPGTPPMPSKPASNPTTLMTSVGVTQEVIPTISRVESSSSSDFFESARSSIQVDRDSLINSPVPSASSVSSLPSVHPEVQPQSVPSSDEYIAPPPSYAPNHNITDVPDHDVPLKSQLRSHALSWHCRACLRDPCVDPVTTVCGHLLCYECIFKELRTKMCCPVCKKAFLIRLDVVVDP